MSRAAISRHRFFWGNGKKAGSIVAGLGINGFFAKIKKRGD
jgi:hypothetical protein